VTTKEFGQRFVVSDNKKIVSAQGEVVSLSGPKLPNQLLISVIDCGFEKLQINSVQIFGKRLNCIIQHLKFFWANWNFLGFKTVPEDSNMISKSIVLSVAIPLWCIFIINFANIENVLIRRV